MGASSRSIRLYRLWPLGLISLLLAATLTTAEAGPWLRARAAPLPGGAAAGGPYALRAVIGQAGAGPLAGDAFTLSGGLLQPRPATATPTPTVAPTTTSTPAAPSPSSTSAAPVPTHTAPAPGPTAAPPNTPAPNCVTSVAGRYALPEPAPAGPVRLFLPVIALPGPLLDQADSGPAAPNLITRFELCPADAGGGLSLRLQLANIGAAATDPHGFWVDAYLNTTAPPRQAVPWDAACPGWPCYGASWFVPRALAPGETLTLLAADRAPDFSVWPEATPLTTLYVYADTYSDSGRPAGAIVESDEGDNRSDLPPGAALGGVLRLPAAPASAGPRMMP